MAKELKIGYTIRGERVNRRVSEFHGNVEHKCIFCAKGRNDCHCKKLLCRATERADGKEVYWDAF